VIEDYITALDRSLSGPARARQRLLAEAHHGLTDAVEAHLATGADTRTASARALSEFGTVAQVRAEFQAELDVAASRHRAMRSVLLVPLITLFWNVTWELNPYPTWPPRSVPFFAVVFISLVVLVSALHAAAVLILTGRCGRGRCWAGMHRQVQLAAATATAAFAIIALLVPTLDPNTLRWPPTIITIGAAAAFGALAAVTRQWSTSRTVHPISQL
jgi:hypothetical protein